MKILAIDSSAGLSVAAHDGTSVVASITRNDHGVQGELAAEFIRQVLTDADWNAEDISNVVVGVGPGLYTGLRVGIVTAQVFAHARGIPVHGICSLDAIGYAHQNDCVVITDARRKELYWARYEAGQRVTEPGVLKPTELLADYPEAEFVGTGALLYPEVINGTYAELYAADLASAFTTGQATLVDVAPMYLRKPDADEPAPRKQVMS